MQMPVHDASRIVQWLLDTRPLWPVPKSTPKEEIQGFKTVAGRALSLLPSSEQASVLRFYHVKDAKLSLASHLLKHLVVTRYCNVPWSQSLISRDSNGKPCFIPNGINQKRIDFNVSHQAGLVSLIAAVGYEQHVDVGTDIVCWNERLDQDYAHIDNHGFFDWIDIHADVFAASEVNHMKLGSLKLDLGVPGELGGYAHDAISRCEKRGQQINLRINENVVYIESDRVIKAKLQRFYAMWCLREAYVKMTGEALMAPWLQELEIPDVQAPDPINDTTDLKCLTSGQTIRYTKIYVKKKKITDVQIELTALGTDFMVSGAVRVLPGMTAGDFTLGRWLLLDLDSDILKTSETDPCPN